MILTIVTFVFVLGILVLVHEWGHFTAAKLMGIKVEEFGFGLPPRAVGRKFGETLYSLNWLPIGGFVRLYGEDENRPDAIKKERNRAFFAKNVLQRSFVLVAGVTMNFILGWFIVSALFVHGVSKPIPPVSIDAVAEGSPAEESGLLTGDEVSAISSQDGKRPIDSTETLIQEINAHRGEEIVLSILRGDEEMSVSVIPRKEHPEDQGALGIVITTNFEKIKYPWYSAPYYGFFESLTIMKAIVVGFGELIRDAVSFQKVEVDVAGPVRISQMVGQAREFGFLAVMNLTAVLSFNLAIINILPFPALDGGRLAFVVIEAVVGRRVKPAWEQHAHQIGMALLLLLLLLITINDVFSLVQG